jgi:hypothetical protein
MSLPIVIGRWTRRTPVWLFLRATASLAAALGVAIATPASAQSANADATDAVQAAFLFNFAKFTTWPKVSDLDTSIKFCVQEGTINPAVFAGWGKKRIQNRPVRVTFVKSFLDETTDNCSISFLRRLPDGVTVKALADDATLSHTLLVSDMAGFGEAGGHIELFIVNRRQRFKVNLGALSKAELSLGAGVLNLAEIVGTEGAKK